MNDLLPSIFSVNFLDLIFKGVLIGIIVSAPMGPVGVLCVQRTLNKGRWYGFVTGCGACVSDIFYAFITGMGVTFIADFVDDANTRFFLQIAGCILLMIFGIYSYRSDPTKKMHISGKKKGTLLNNAITAFFVTLSNPLIVFLFMACYAQLAFVIPMRPLEIFVAYTSIALGALLWWYSLTWVVDLARTNFNEKGIIIINKTIGIIVIFVSILVFFGTAFNLYSLSF